MMMQKYDEKSSRLNALWSYKGDNLNVEDYDPEEVKFQLIKDPEKRASLKILRESADLKKQVRIQGATYDNLYESRNNYDTTNNSIKTIESSMNDAQKEVDSKVAAVESAKENLEKAKKTLASAKKAKDDDLIELANAKVDKANIEVYTKFNIEISKEETANINYQIKKLSSINF